MRRLAVMMAALAMLGCEMKAQCLRVEGHPPQTVYANFGPDRGCFYFARTSDEGRYSDSICGSFSLSGGACPAEAAR